MNNSKIHFRKVQGILGDQSFSPYDCYMKDRRRKRSKDFSKQISNNIRQLSKYLIIFDRVYRANLLIISLLISAAILGIIIGVIVADTYGTQQEEQQQQIPINGSTVKLTQNYEFIDENELAEIESNDD